MNARSWAAVVLAPLVLLAILLARPKVDVSWENQRAHFWLVLGAAVVATALGWAISTAARRRQDARLLLISLAFIASSGFLGLHALATPTVLLGPNAGFELATPFGLVVAGVFAAASALELAPEHARSVVRHAPTPACRPLRADGGLGSGLPRRAPTARRTARGRGARRLAARARRGRPRSLRPRGTRLRAPVPETARALRVRVYARLCVPGRGDGRHRLGEQLAALLVGVARADARRVPRDRAGRAGRMARGALQPALSGRDARRGEEREHRPGRSRRLHPLLGAARSRRRSPRCSTRTSSGSSR